jgi:hypothetical protein
MSSHRAWAPLFFHAVCNARFVALGSISVLSTTTTVNKFALTSNASILQFQMEFLQLISNGIKDFEDAFDVEITILDSCNWTKNKGGECGSSWLYMQSQLCFDTMFSITNIQGEREKALYIAKA